MDRTAAPRPRPPKALPLDDDDTTSQSDWEVPHFFDEVDLRKSNRRVSVVAYDAGPYVPAEGRPAGLDYRSLFLSLSSVVCMTICIISLKRWGATLDDESAYFMLLFGSAGVFICLGLLCIAFKLVFRSLVFLPFPRYRVWFVSMALAATVCSILITYASASQARAPASLHYLLFHTNIYWGIPVSLVLLTVQEARLPICDWQPLHIFFAILGGMVLTLSPGINTAIHNENLFTTSERIAWTVGFVIAMLPNAIVNILQEKFLKLRIREETDNCLSRRTFDILVMLVICSGIQVVLVGCSIIMNTLPHYGVADSYEGILEALKEGCECIFAGDDSGCSFSWLYALIFIGSAVLLLLTMAGLNETSAQYSMLSTTLALPIVGICYYVLPTLGPSHPAAASISTSELWASIPALFVLLIALAWWKIWENRQRLHHVRATFARGTSSLSYPGL